MLHCNTHHRMKRTLGIVVSVFILFISILALFSVRWMANTWNDMTVNELLFQMSTLNGTGGAMGVQYILKCLVPGLGLTALIVLVIFVIVRRARFSMKRVYFANAGLTCIFLFLALYRVWEAANVSEYLVGQTQESQFAEEHYVDPSTVDISFTKKKNLVYIFLESVEVTDTDFEHGGNSPEDLIPELTGIAQENEDFSGESDQINGAYAMPGTTWTSVAMVAQTSGLPTLISDATAFPKITALGDILAENGYHQELLIGSNGDFGGRAQYFKTHGNYQIIDYDYARENGWIAPDYYEWWGYEDEKLFSFAKERL